jgi:hypothetical protein
MALQRYAERHGTHVIERRLLLAEELQRIVLDTGSPGKNPDQRVSATLQELRDRGLVRFLARGKYRLIQGDGDRTKCGVGWFEPIGYPLELERVFAEAPPGQGTGTEVPPYGKAH